jgi:hypothetical protein
MVLETCRWEFALHHSSLSLVWLVIDKDAGARALPVPITFIQYA